MHAYFAASFTVILWHFVCQMKLNGPFGQPCQQNPHPANNCDIEGCNEGCLSPSDKAYGASEQCGIGPCFLFLPSH